MGPRNDAFRREITRSSDGLPLCAPTGRRNRGVPGLGLYHELTAATSPERLDAGTANTLRSHVDVTTQSIPAEYPGHGGEHSTVLPLMRGLPFKGPIQQAWETVSKARVREPKAAVGTAADSAPYWFVTGRYRIQCVPW